MVPSKLVDVRYRLGGSDAYRGVLVLTYGACYYLPRVDVLEARKAAAHKIASTASLLAVAAAANDTVLGDAAGGAAGAALLAERGGRHVTEATFDLEALLGSLGLVGSKAANSADELRRLSDTLRAAIDAEISRARQHKSVPFQGPSSMPAPLRITASETSTIAMSPFGRLKIETEGDVYEFRVGLLKAIAVARALATAGFEL